MVQGLQWESGSYPAVLEILLCGDLFCYCHNVIPCVVFTLYMLHLSCTGLYNHSMLYISISLFFASVTLQHFSEQFVPVASFPVLINLA
jgi:hypothetical protein